MPLFIAGQIGQGADFPTIHRTNRVLKPLIINLVFDWTLRKMPSPLLDSLRGTPVYPRPLWLMRQAGRYLPEYRALRAAKAVFWTLSTILLRQRKLRCNLSGVSALAVRSCFPIS